MNRHPWLIGAMPFAFLAALFIAAGDWWTGLGVIGFLVVCGSLGSAFVRAEANVRLRDDARHLADELAASNARLAEVLDEHSLCPTPLVPFDSLSKAERDHIAAARPDLRIVPPLDEDVTWPRLAEAIEIETATPVHDDLDVERFVESVERWGNEAEHHD